MLRQLARLTARVPAAGDRALAVAVYARSDGRSFAARETGVEGVACIDDAARAYLLLSGLWARTGNEDLRRWADGLLEFILWMREGDGRWINFIYDWDGHRNRAGATSAPGSNFWQARATQAVTRAALRDGHAGARAALPAAFAAAAADSPPADVRSLHVSAGLQLLRCEPDPSLRTTVGGWCDEILACTREGRLMNSPDERGQPHLWGHIQEAVLTEAAGQLGRPDLASRAEASAVAVFGDAIDSGFDLPHVSPYDVASAVHVMDRLWKHTEDARFRAWADQAREWFRGRNPAGHEVYQRDLGRVADGIDHAVVNQHSGAEANISAGLALLDDPLVLEQAAGWSGMPGSRTGSAVAPS